MKISITGHTNGVGKHLYDVLSTEHNVTGFSTSNDYDISDPKDRIRIANHDYDVFINNAYDYFSMGNGSQLEMLKMLDWENKLIINISSMITEVDYDKGELELTYEEDKKQLDLFCRNKRICNIKPNQLKTRITEYKGQELTSISKIVNFVLDNPSFFLHTITVS